jgi:IS30 family transposase
MYVAKFAQQAYEKLLVEAREGIPLDKEKFYEADRVIAAGIRKGQHLYHILQSNDLKVSKSTVYRHLQKGYLSIAAIDFPRVVKFKPRKEKPAEHVPKGVRIGRTHADFLAYTQENDISIWTEMDTVIGRVGGKALLTLHFTLFNFMAGILLDHKTTADVTTQILSLKQRFTAEGLRFGDIMPLILTDNGVEFSDVISIENDQHGLKETGVFFCDPMQSCQKARVEKNHTLLRDIAPKGTSFDSFTQETVNLIFSHVNSVKRKILNGKTPYELFCFTYGEKAAHILGVSSVSPGLVVQSPMLLSKAK